MSTTALSAIGGFSKYVFLSERRDILIQVFNTSLPCPTCSHIFHLSTLRRGLPGEATQATHEKRVLVLERALEHHPASEALMVELLEASAPLLDAEALCVRWQQVGCLPQGGRCGPYAAMFIGLITWEWDIRQQVCWRNTIQV